jgi:hypothetical protein
MLLLALALVGMHQLVAAAHGSALGTQPTAASPVVDHVAHGADASAACHHEPAGTRPDCTGSGDTCVAVLDDPWVDAEPPSGPPAGLRECVGSLLATWGDRGPDKPPDLSRLSVWRT